MIEMRDAGKILSKYWVIRVDDMREVLKLLIFDNILNRLWIQIKINFLVKN